MAIMTEEKADYITEATEMLGKGYEIHAPAVVMEMGEGFHLQQVENEAWVKISTSFKKVMPYLKGANLAVFIAISLSINDKGECFPGIDTLADCTGYSRRAVFDAIRELEQTGFLTITHGVKKSNLYHVNAFAAFGDTQPESAELSPTSRGAKTAPATDSAKIAPVQKTTPMGAKNDTENAEIVHSSAPELDSLTRTNNEKNPRTHKFSSFETSQLKSEYMQSSSASFRKAHLMLLNVSHLPAIPRDQDGYIDTVQAMIDRYGEEATKGALERACVKWISTQGKNGRNYSKTNFKWVDWAMDAMEGGGKPAATFSPAYDAMMAELRGARNEQ
jgi:hypothetical protein